MEDNRKIAEWAGYKVNKQRNTAFIQERYDYYITSKDRDIDGNYWVNPLPHYTTSDSDAVTLLPVLVKKGYWFILGDGHELICGQKCEEGEEEAETIEATNQPTIAAAITSAVLALIERKTA